jgi:soluble lytic murein transglycosylase
MNSQANPVRRPWYRKKRLWLPFFALLVVVLAWRSSGFWDALSPLTHKKELYELGGVYKVDPLLLAAIIRSESHFYPFAESKAGAVGLMQLMPATAREMARELKLDYQNPKDLYRESINLKLGSHYFAKLLRLFDGNLVLSLAAYNAGRANVLSWKLKAYGSDQQGLIAAIPVPQTRAYVERVLETYRAFKRVQAVKRWLGGEA